MMVAAAAAAAAGGRGGGGGDGGGCLHSTGERNKPQRRIIGCVCGGGRALVRSAPGRGGREGGSPFWLCGEKRMFGRVAQVPPPGADNFALL